MFKKKAKKHDRKYTLGEEIFNAVTHGVGSLLSVAGCVILIVFGAVYGDVWSVVSNSVFGASLIILYTSSTLYHSLTNAKAKAVFRILDHDTIFFLIAGTYTPITLCTIRRYDPAMGWTLFAIVWAAAIVGIVLNSISIEKYKIFSIIAYIAMGWIVVIAIKPIIDNMGLKPMLYLFGGGIAYTVGVFFYKMKSVKYMHSIWHLFTVAGSVLHFFFVLFYVSPLEPKF